MLPDLCYTTTQRVRLSRATLAQLVEHPPCKRTVRSSSLLSGSIQHMAPDWNQSLAPVWELLESIADFLAQENAAQRGFLPQDAQIFRAFSYPLSEVKVLIVGQDPYPTPGHPIGLAFATAPDVQPLPRSLANIFAEYQADLGFARPANGDLRPWARQGVMLLNRVLSVTPGKAGSHQGRGWEEFTRFAIRCVLERRNQPLVGILWGNQARALAPLFREAAYPVIESPHPSPLSASRGFFGSRPFSRANELLVCQGATPIDWELPAATLF